MVKSDLSKFQTINAIMSVESALAPVCRVVCVSPVFQGLGITEIDNISCLP